MDTTRNSDKFVNIYNELDKWMRNIIGVGYEMSHTDLIRRIAGKDKTIRKYEEYLKSFANLRNAIVHNPKVNVFESIAEPHDSKVRLYESIKNTVLHPPLAIDTIAVKSNEIKTTNSNQRALDVMRMMKEKTYTHIPVIEDGVLIGVFSENTILSYMVKNEDILIERDATISEFIDFIPIDKHESEYFKFVSKNTLVIDIEEIFERELEVKRRLGVIFITENGKSGEKILGLVTAWDIAGYTAKIV
jgi:predicted transcriptional regulator